MTDYGKSRIFRNNNFFIILHHALCISRFDASHCLNGFWVCFEWMRSINVVCDNFNHTASQQTVFTLLKQTKYLMFATSVTYSSRLMHCTTFNGHSYTKKKTKNLFNSFFYLFFPFNFVWFLFYPIICLSYWEAANRKKIIVCKQNRKNKLIRVKPGILDSLLNRRMFWLLMILIA